MLQPECYWVLKEIVMKENGEHVPVLHGSTAEWKYIHKKKKPKQ